MNPLSLKIVPGTQFTQQVFLSYYIRVSATLALLTIQQSTPINKLAYFLAVGRVLTAAVSLKLYITMRFFIGTEKVAYLFNCRLPTA